MLIDTTPDKPLEYVENQSMATAGLAGSAAGVANDATAAAPAPAANDSTPAQATPAAAPAAGGAAAAEPEAPDDMDYEE